jgi:O-antigen/teichoic acid export membrane protein
VNANDSRRPPFYAGSCSRSEDFGRGIRGHLAAPLYRNAYFLILGAGLGAALGFVFWGLATHHYSADAVGLNSAVISAMMLVSGISQLGLNAVLYRYLPRAGRSTRRLVVRSYLVTSGLSVLASLAAGLTSPWWAPNLTVLRHGFWLASFVVATTAWTIFSLQDSVLTGLRQAQWIPIEDALFSGAKIALLPALAAAAPRGGLFLAWNIPVLISLIPVNLLIFRRLIPKYVQRTHIHPLQPRAIIRFASGNYVGTLFLLASTTLLPILVARESGTRATAFFYVPWAIAAGLQLVALTMTTSLTVEVALDESKLRDHCRRVVVHTMRIVVPLSIFLAAGAPYVLRAFGSDYASRGTTLLRLLALATVPNVFVALGLSVARIQHDARLVLLAQGALCALTIGGSLFLLPREGIDGVGIAWIVSQLAVALWFSLGILRPVFLQRAAQDIGMAQGQDNR